MADEKVKVEVIPAKVKETTKNSDNLAMVLSEIITLTGDAANPWTSKDIDKLSSKDLIKEYQEAVKSCRFFYRKDPLASSVINKLVDIAITEIEFGEEKVTPNQMRVFESLKDQLEDFSEDCALEYLVSGLVIPEVEYVTETKKQVTERGIKTYNSLKMPDSIWIRNAESIIINSPLIGGKPSYYVKVPEEMLHFIKHKGKYKDGTEDKELYNEILKLYPKFVQQILNNVKEIQLENPYVIRRKPMTDSPYPIPYLYSALESLKHKRNIRRMDYSIAARVISAIQLIKMGDKDFPLTENNQEQLSEVRSQMRWRDTLNRNVERIFQLFSNHTLTIEWVFPPTEAMLDDTKYKDVNADILYALGFPRILITGETERSGTSDSDLALLSPVKTMNKLRSKIIRIIRKIIIDVAEKNDIKNVPEVYFKPMNLHAFKEFLEGLQKLYEAGNLSRESHAEVLGYRFKDEIVKRAEETKTLKKLGLDEFAPLPHSNTPDTNKNNEETPKNNEEIAND